MNLSSKFIKILFVCTIFSTITSFAYDNSHFYRAHFFESEPRFERDYLTSFDIVFGGGSTCKAFGQDGQKTCLLDLCGCYNMQYLGKNVPCKDLSRESDLIMQQLENQPSDGSFGLLSFSGKFNTWEADISFSQNFKNGIFLNLHIPIRMLEIKNICYQDATCQNDQNCLTPCCNNTTGNNIYWQAFLNSFCKILQDYNLSIAQTKAQGLGDVSAVLGYTINYEETEALDFIDATFRFGVTTPTSKVKNENYVFSLPLGYNGHTGVFACVDAAFGVYDWATLGLHVDAMTFNRICKYLRIKTAYEQSGLIKLTGDTAREKLGNIYNASAYFKFDHFVKGLSLLAAYCYTAREAIELDCFKNSCINCQIANSDCSLQRWNMHTVNLIAEYDFCEEENMFYPRINAFYNIVAGGKRIFDTNIAGAGIGFDVDWK